MTTTIKVKPFHIDNLQLKKTTNFRAFNEELNQSELLKSFAQNGCCKPCKSAELFQSLNCDCINHTASLAKLYFKHMLPEYKAQSLRKLSDIIKLYLPTSADSMMEVICEEDALALEKGLAKVTIMPLEQFRMDIEYQNLPLAIFVNDKLGYVSTSYTYSDCSRTLETYMNSY